MSDKYKVIATRRNKRIQTKQKIWKLISDSYAGGEQYQSAKHLFKYARESKESYEARLNRAVYDNHVQPLSDILSGFLFNQEPDRKIPKSMSYLMDKCSKGKGLPAFMRTVAIHSLLHSCFILIDSPKFDKDMVKTKADRASLGLNPYAVLYMPGQVIDYAIDNKGELLWILLDNSYENNTDPFKDSETITEYRLWTRADFMDFTIEEKGKNKTVVLKAEGKHNIGYVPGMFVNWRDKDEDYITESPFEDIAMLSRAVYNNMSYLDEMIASGTFKMLIYPCDKPDQIPAEIKAGGIGALSAIPFKDSSKHYPDFIGAGLEDIASFGIANDIYLKAIFRKLGFDKDDDRKYVQSGYAKSLEFQKAEMLLSHGAQALEDAEKFIVNTAAAWENQKVDSDITYAKKFQSEELDAELSRLYQAWALNIKAIQSRAIKEIASKTLHNQTQADKDKMLQEIEKELDEQTKRETEFNVDDLVNDEKDSRNNTPNPSEE